MRFYEGKVFFQALPAPWDFAPIAAALGRRARALGGADIFSPAVPAVVILAVLSLHTVEVIALSLPSRMVLLAAAALLVCALAHSRRLAWHEARKSRRCLGRLRQASLGANAVLLRWDLIAGRLEWLGGGLPGLSVASLPSSFPELRTLIHPEDSLYGEIAKALKSRSSAVNWRFRLKADGGGWQTLELRAAIGWTRRGNGPEESPILEGLLLVHEDGASEPEGETLSKSGAALGAAIEALPISFALWDSEQRLILCNRKFRQTFKLPLSAAVTGRTLKELQGATEEPICQGTRGFDTGMGRFEVFDAQLSDGTWLQVGEHRSADGNLVSVATDITALKLSERRLFEREQQLRVAVRDAEENRLRLEFQTAQLRDLAERYSLEKTRAEEANKAKSAFLANISHELRTPLNAIIGFSDMMRQQTLGPIGHPKYLGYAKDIIDSGQYLLGFINDILDMAKIEAGRFRLTCDFFQAGGLIEDCLRVIAPAAAERKVSLTEGGNLQAMIWGDYRALKQVVINLLSNAVKFTMPGGQVQLKVYKYRGSVRLAITDTGIGIAKHDLQKLAKPFEQLENQLTKGHKGTGLGLAISKSLVELHGGKLEIKSKLGEGTTVTCILPAVETAPEEREAA